MKKKWIALGTTLVLAAALAMPAMAANGIREIKASLRPDITIADSSKGSADIGLEKAKKIALEDAGLKERKVIFVTAKADFDDGRKEYEVEFYCDGTEYDYEIDAATGKILKAEKDIDD